MLGFAEQLEYLASIEDSELEPFGGRESLEDLFRRVACVTSDHYIEGYSSRDGIPFWDTGAPGLVHLPGYRQEISDPFNPFEPVDSSAAAIAAQGLVRLGHYLLSIGEEASARRYMNAGLTIAETLLSDPYMSEDPRHQGLLLHSVYHRPNGWDHIPAGQKVPCGESSMWGDYHLMELVL